MKRHILCIDLDDTISNTYSTVLKLAKEYDKKELNRTGMAEENIKSSDDYYFARMLKWTREETITFYQKYYPT